MVPVRDHKYQNIIQYHIFLSRFLQGIVAKKCHYAQSLIIIIYCFQILDEIRRIVGKERRNPQSFMNECLEQFSEVK